MKYTPAEQMRASLEDLLEKPSWVFPGWFQSAEADRVILSPKPKNARDSQADVSAEIRKTKDDISLALSWKEGPIRKNKNEVSVGVNQKGEIWVMESRKLVPGHTIHVIGSYDGETGIQSELKMAECNSQGRTAHFYLNHFLDEHREMQNNYVKSRIGRFIYKMNFFYIPSFMQERTDYWKIEMNLCSIPHSWAFWEKPKALTYVAVELPEEISAYEMVYIIQDKKEKLLGGSPYF